MPVPALRLRVPDLRVLRWLRMRDLREMDLRDLREMDLRDLRDLRDLSVRCVVRAIYNICTKKLN